MKALTFAFLLMIAVVMLYALGVTTIEPAGPPAYLVAVPEEQPPPPPPPPAPVAPLPPPIAAEPVRESVEGLPVPIYPGTRVEQAEIAPPRVVVTRKPHITVHLKSRATRTPAGDQHPRFGTHTVVGQLRGTEQRAIDDARRQLDREVAMVLAPEVPASWKAPATLVNRLIVRTEVKPVAKDYGTLYEAHMDVDFNRPRLGEIRAAYQRERVAHRIMGMAGGLGFVLACLASLAGYIRADEATKGYYTNWLRVAAGAGVGAAGVVIYQLMS